MMSMSVLVGLVVAQCFICHTAHKDHLDKVRWVVFNRTAHRFWFGLRLTNEENIPKQENTAGFISLFSVSVSDDFSLESFH